VSKSIDYVVTYLLGLLVWLGICALVGALLADALIRGG